VFLRATISLMCLMMEAVIGSSFNCFLVTFLAVLRHISLKLPWKFAVGPRNIVLFVISVVVFTRS
jgi:hypothetical protein